MTYYVECFALKYTCEKAAHMELVIKNHQDESFRTVLAIPLENAAKLAKRLGEEVKIGKKLEKESKGK